MRQSLHQAGTWHQVAALWIGMNCPAVTLMWPQSIFSVPTWKHRRANRQEAHEAITIWIEVGGLQTAIVPRSRAPVSCCKYRRLPSLGRK